jgi:hypothetical protein
MIWPVLAVAAVAARVAGFRRGRALSSLAK